tara:strand:+ start:334 stop:609 length:276 start_codon:yes stop_codon:yes gene_type:complete
MKSINYYDSSYSPNEACEVNNDYMDCGACFDMGMIDEQVYCDCRHGKALVMHDYEDERALLNVDLVRAKLRLLENERMDSLRDEMSYNGDC